MIPLMIPNKERENWHYLAVKKSSFLREVTLKHHGYFYCLNCLHILLEQKINSNLMKKYVEIQIFVEL